MLLLAAPIAAGCGSSSEGGAVDTETADAVSVATEVEPQAAESDTSELDAALARWRSAGPESYKLRLERSCFCSLEYVGPYIVTVRGGEMVDVAYAPDVEEEGLPPPPPGRAVDVEGLFRIARQVLEEADDVRITYDDQLGYPTTIDIDYTFDAVDDEEVIAASILR